jgi:hypothetical protein
VSATVSLVHREGGACIFQLFGHQQILLARRRIAGGVIVHEDDRLGRVLDRGTEDLARMNQAAIECANADQMRADNLKLDIQGDDVKFLLGRIACLSSKLVTAELKSVVRIRDAGDGFADRQLPL